MLLAAVIDKVVILPIPSHKLHPGSAGRPLRIYWKENPISVERPPEVKGVKGTGRALVLAREQLNEATRQREARSSRVRAYFEEWRRFQNESSLRFARARGDGSSGNPGEI